MLPKSSHWLWLIAIVLLTSSFWIWISRVPAQAEGTSHAVPHVGFQAPDITLTRLEGGTVSLQAFRGQPIILNFWASWCGPCRAEMPALQQILTQYAADGLVVLLVNQGESETTITRFLAKENLTVPIMLDKELTATTLYQVRALPTTFFIDQEGQIMDLKIGGPMTEAYLKSRVSLLMEGQ